MASAKFRCEKMEAFLSAMPCRIRPSICPGVPQSVFNLPPTSLDLLLNQPLRPLIRPRIRTRVPD